MICFKYSLMFIVMFMFFFMSGLIFLSMDCSMLLEFSIFNMNSNFMVMVVYIDWLSLMFSSIVFLISASVMIYSKEYMESEKNFTRFIILVFIFVMSMIFMIMSPNLISILLGWDGLGLVSYCLVIYYQNEKSYNAGMLTFLTNRIGDVSLLMAIVWVVNYGSWNFLFYLSYISDDKMMVSIMLFIVLSAFTKSAQIPFSASLPAAMAAPTPVSSLVHSSTLVTAGIYLMIRFNFGVSGFLMDMILFFSVITKFMAGLVANLKKMKMSGNKCHSVEVIKTSTQPLI